MGAVREPMLTTRPVELLGERTENSKHFLKPDGSYTALFSNGPIHYKRSISSGVWLHKKFAFRPDGDGWISDNSDIIVRTYQEKNCWWIEFIETLSGRGIAFLLPSEPIAIPGSSSISFLDKRGEAWTYTHTRDGGKLLGPTTSLGLGKQTLAFKYRLIGGPPLTQNADGSVSCGDIFSVCPPHLMGADGMRYAYASWLVDAETLSFTYTDRGLPQSAYPYRVDPSTTFNISAGANDILLEKAQASYPPTAGLATLYDTLNFIAVGRTLSAGTFYQDVSMCKWTTSSLGGGSLVTGATFRGYITAKTDTDSLSLTASWEAWTGAEADYTTGVLSGAHAGTTIASMTVGADKDFVLLSPSSNVSTTATTYLKIGASQRASDAAPTGVNSANIASLEGANGTNYPVGKEPRLLVDYTNATRIVPDGIISRTNLTTWESGGVNQGAASDAQALAAIDEDPDSPDTNWLTV